MVVGVGLDRIGESTVNPLRLEETARERGEGLISRQKAAVEAL
jgi:hypothetical protein